MKKIFQRIWEIALPYQDQRDDPGHAEVTLGYARSLLESDHGDEDIVIPAIILHDVGYSQLPKERRLKVFDRSLKDEERTVVQMEHEKAGVELARELLKEADYPPEFVEEILEIISQHDTRKGFISQNEGLVRDSDKLWRFSKRGFEAGEKRMKPGEDFKWADIEASIDKADYFYSDTSKRMARQELAARKAERGKSDPGS